MSLFNEIRRLYRRDKFEMEDFHTEIVAQVLKNSHTLAIDWLVAIGAVKLSNTRVISIGTQEEFAPLEKDDPGSRVDMVVRLCGDGGSQIVFIESKVDSTENPGQLQKYADVAKREGFDRSAIVYVTRDFEIARPPPVITTRWLVFYNYLKVHVNGDGLAEQLKLFMEEHRMAMRNQFTAIDSLALGNFVGARALMDETMWAGLNKKFEEILGKISSATKCMIQLRDEQRYVMYVELGRTYDFECILGYWLPSGGPTEPTWVGVKLYSNPKSPIRKTVISGFRDFARKNGQWKHEQLDDDKEWASISRGADLPTFMAQSDHLQAIRDHFSLILDDVKRFRSQHPELPWSTSAAERAEEA